VSVPARASFDAILFAMAVLQHVDPVKLEEYADELHEVDETLSEIIDDIGGE
jgi:hypothetical protein